MVFKKKQKLIPIVMGSTVTIILFVIITLLSFAPIRLSGSFGPISVDKAYHVCGVFLPCVTIPYITPKTDNMGCSGDYDLRWLD